MNFDAIDGIHARNIKNTSIIGEYLDHIIDLVNAGIIFDCLMNYFGVDQNISNYLLGVGLSMFAMICWSIGSILIARNKINMNAYNSIGWQMLISACCMGMYTIYSGQYIGLNEIPAVAWGAIIYMVIGGSIFAFISFIYSMKHLHPAIASLYAYINPIVAIWVGSLLLGEKMTWNSILGTICTLIGVYLVNRSLKNQKDPVDAVADADAM
jgi:drug/metabolite transporter (DMT)-like permease